MTGRYPTWPEPADYIPASAETVTYWLARIRAQLAHQPPPDQTDQPTLDLDD